MDNHIYYGVYSAGGNGGCVAEFVTAPREIINFPPGVNYYCRLCSKHHTFQYRRTQIASTPIQVRNFMNLADRQGWEVDVEL